MASLKAAVTNWRTHLLVERGLSAATMHSYQRDSDRYIEWLEDRGVKDLDEVDAPTIGLFIEHLSKSGLAARSIARALSVIRNLHKFAVQEGYVSQDVARDVPTPQQPQYFPQSLTISEVESLLSAIPSGDAATPIDLRDLAILEMLYGTGARVSELMGLMVDDTAHLEQGYVRYLGKGDKHRVVPVGGAARRAVDAYVVRGRPALANGHSHVLFLNTRGNALSRQSAWGVIKQRAERAGIAASITPHTLRHSYATHLLEGGANVRMVQELLGHASVTTTQIYTHISADQLRQTWTAAHPRA